MIPWIRLTSSMMLLGFEAQRVVLLRLIRIAAGGAHAQAEISRMVPEKVFATVRAIGMVTLGRSPESVVRHYRSRVRANERRLSRRKRYVR
jgi:hypothetical protein